MSCDGNIHDDHVEGTRLTKVGRYPLTLMAHAMIARHVRFQRRPEGFIPWVPHRTFRIFVAGPAPDPVQLPLQGGHGRLAP